MTKNPAVFVLIVATVAAFLLQGASGDSFELLFALWPLQAVSDGHSYFHVWQLVTYAFLHDPHNLGHIFFNMFGVFMFGAPVERYVGGYKLYACYFAAVVTAAITQLIVPPLVGAPLVPTVGASGGVFGLLLAYAVLFPQARVALLFLPIPIARADLRRPLCGCRADFRIDRHASGRRALRASRRNGRRRPGDRSVAAAGAAHVSGRAYPIAAKPARLTR